MAEKEVVTVMILYVDLKCSSCYKKVKKLLCKFPQIRDQVFDEDKNKVMITVVCCNPEKLRDKLCCKSGKAIESIEIVEKSSPYIPKQEEKRQKPKESEKPKQPSSPTPAVVVSKPFQPQLEPVKKPDLHQPFCPPVSVCCQECSEGRGGGPCHYGYGRHIPSSPCPSYNPKKPDPPAVTPSVVSKPPQPPSKPVKKPDPVPQHQPFCPPVSVCCQECSEGRGGGPCHYGYGRHIPSSPCLSCNPKKPDSPAVTPSVVSKPPQSPSEPVKKPDPVPQHQPFCPPVSVCCQECSEGRGGGPCHYGYGRHIPSSSCPSYNPKKPDPPAVMPSVVSKPPQPPSEPVKKPDPVPQHQPFCPPVSVCCQECSEGRGGGPCHCPPVSVCCQECYEGRGGGPCHCPPVSVCCQECYEGRGGGPCHYGYGRHIPPSRPCYDPNYGYQYRPRYVTRCDYFSEENPQGCSIM